MTGLPQCRHKRCRQREKVGGTGGKTERGDALIGKRNALRAQVPITSINTTILATSGGRMFINKRAVQKTHVIR